MTETTSSRLMPATAAAAATTDIYRTADFDRLSPAEQAALFAGRGGVDKAAAVRELGVGALATMDGSGRLTEAPLKAIAETPAGGS